MMDAIERSRAERDVETLTKIANLMREIKALLPPQMTVLYAEHRIEDFVRSFDVAVSDLQDARAETDIALGTFTIERKQDLQLNVA